MMAEDVKPGEDAAEQPKDAARARKAPAVVRMRLAGFVSTFHHGVAHVPPLTQQFVDVPEAAAGRVRELAAQSNLDIEETR